MRIGYFYNLQAYPPRGGNHVHALELTQGFLALGHSVSVMDDPTMPGVANHSSDHEGIESFIDAIDILYVRIDARLTYRWKALSECMKRVGQRPMVWEINAPANEALAFSWLGGRLLRSSARGESVFQRAKRQIHAWRQLPRIVREERHRRRLSRDVDAAVCVSSALGRYARQELGIPDVLVLPNGGPLISEAEIRERRNRRSHDRFTVLYSGSAIYPWQGLDYLCETIKLAEQEAPDIRFVLAVNQRTPGLPSSANTIVREALNREQILDAICSADACVALHPEYFWSKHQFHNSPMKMFEYMACMRPVVTSNLGQMREILHDGVDGLLCANDPRDILRKLLWIRDHGDEAEKIGYRGWQRIQSDFNWPRNVEKTVEVFQRVIHSRPVRRAVSTQR